jgi:hypothetical protein
VMRTSPPRSPCSLAWMNPVRTEPHCVPTWLCSTCAQAAAAGGVRLWGAGAHLCTHQLRLAPGSCSGGGGQPGAGSVQALQKISCLLYTAPIVAWILNVCASHQIHWPATVLQLALVQITTGCSSSSQCIHMIGRLRWTVCNGFHAAHPFLQG